MWFVCKYCTTPSVHVVMKNYDKSIKEKKKAFERDDYFEEENYSIRKSKRAHKDGKPKVRKMRE